MRIVTCLQGQSPAIMCLMHVFMLSVELQCNLSQFLEKTVLTTNAFYCRSMSDHNGIMSAVIIIPVLILLLQYYNVHVSVAMSLLCYNTKMIQLVNCLCRTNIFQYTQSLLLLYSPENPFIPFNILMNMTSNGFHKHHNFS